MPAQRKYPGELRERAVKMVFEDRDRDGKGCQARGVDEDGYADWINRVTGTPDDFPHADRDLDFHAWSGAHEWMLSAERIGVLSHEAARSGTPMFLCGTAS